MRRVVLLAVPFAAAAGGYELVVRGVLTLDLGIGRRVRPLGPITRTIAAPREVVFDVIAAPYLERTPRAMHDKLRVWERGSDMALAEHLTKTGRLTTATLETVRFERPHRITFRLVRGPVPHVTETYELDEAPEGPPRSSTPGRWVPTYGSWDSGGPTASRTPGNTPSPPRWTQSSPKPSAAPANDHPSPPGRANPPRSYSCNRPSAGARKRDYSRVTR